MDWRQRNDGKRVVASPIGRVDEDSWKAFGDHLTAAVAEAGAAGLPLALDLSRLEYMTSKGLRALTVAKTAAQSAGGKAATVIHLASPNETMRRILSISRYDMLFPVVDDVEQVGGL